MSFQMDFHLVMMMMMMMMMMKNCFCGMVDRGKVFSLISSRDHCQRSSPSRISNTPRAGFEPAQNLSSGLVEWSCSVVITTTPRRHEIWFTKLLQLPLAELRKLTHDISAQLVDNNGVKDNHFPENLGCFFLLEPPFKIRPFALLPTNRWY